MVAQDKMLATAIDLTVAAVRLIRWLRAIDPTPAFTPAQASAMGVIIHSGGVTPSQLADHEQVRRPTISRLIEELEAQGYVRRVPHPSDQRSSVLTVTELGTSLWLAGQDRRARPLAERIAALPEADRRTLERAAELLMALPEQPGTGKQEP